MCRKWANSQENCPAQPLHHTNTIYVCKLEFKISIGFGCFINIYHQSISISIIYSSLSTISFLHVSVIIRPSSGKHWEVDSTEGYYNMQGQFIWQLSFLTYRRYSSALWAGCWVAAVCTIREPTRSDKRHWSDTTITLYKYIKMLPGSWQFYLFLYA
jgi:hypothetical protein